MEINIEKNVNLKQKKDNECLGLFEHLFDTYYKALTIYSYKFVNDWQAAEDITQDVFMSIWMNKNKIDFSKPINTYLYRAIYNRSINYINSSLMQYKNKESLTIDEMINEEIMVYNQHDELLQKEISNNINEFIETLPPQCKKVYKLSRVQNLKNKEIAYLLNISEKTVEKHISKALEELRSHLIKLEVLSFILLWI